MTPRWRPFEDSSAVADAERIKFAGWNLLQSDLSIQLRIPILSGSHRGSVYVLAVPRGEAAPGAH